MRLHRYMANYSDTVGFVNRESPVPIGLIFDWILLGLLLILGLLHIVGRLSGASDL